MMTPDDGRLGGVVVPNWRVAGRVRAFTTVRAGGVSSGPFGDHDQGGGLNLGIYCGDDPGAVLENRRRLTEVLPAEPCWLKQVHGVDVVKLWEGKSPPAVTSADHEPQADAAVTDRQDVVLAILSADCLPVLLCDQHARVVGAAHAGWRGLAAGVLETTVCAMHERLGSDASITAWLGPAIGPTAFEVGEDVLDAFTEHDPQAARHFKPAGREAKWFADLAGLASDRLWACGVREISASGHCTFLDAQRFYSHRRDRVSGRIASLIWLAA